MCAVFAALVVAVAPAVAASASQGSVPSEVARYSVDPDGLVARLDDLVGIDSSGKGIDFSAGVTVGQLNRVHTFTAAFLAGEVTDAAVELTNLWSAPLLIGEKPIGLATIWINPATDAPDLADFVQDAELAIALADVPAEAFLVYDGSVSAWFSLNGSRLSTILPGASGVGGELPLTVYQRQLVERSAVQQTSAAQQAATVGQGTVVAGIVVVIAVITVVVVLLLPKRTSREESPAA
jgi:hypothetical protein